MKERISNTVMPIRKIHNIQEIIVSYVYTHLSFNPISVGPTSEQRYLYEFPDPLLMIFILLLAAVVLECF